MPTPSLLIVPARFKSGKLYSQIPTSGAGDFTVTRALNTATRVNASGFIESVASGIPRLDYFASGGTVGCPALLVEPAATNGILNSTDTTTNWTLGANLTSGAIDVIGVSGNNITVAVSGSGIGSAAGRFVRFNNNVALASGSTYTVSFLIKKTGSHTIGGYQLLMSSGVIGSGFDVSGSFASGSNVDTAPTTNRIRRIERFGTDVFRCSETFTMTAAATGTHLAFGPVNSVTVSTNSAVGTTIGFAAPQIELGSVPTSFIPTTTGSVTRNADVVTVSGAVSGSIGQTEGTIYAEVDVRNITAGKAILSIDDGSTSNRVGLFVDTSPNRLSVSISNSGTFTSISGSITTGVHKMALSYASGDVQIFLNGGFLASGVPTVFPTVTRNNLSIGCRILSGVYGAFFNDRILAAALYTTRLTNAQLASLTSP